MLWLYRVPVRCCDKFVGAQAVNLVVIGKIVAADWLVYVSTVACQLAGQLVGHTLHKRLTQDNVVSIVIGLLSLSAALLLGRGQVVRSLLCIGGMALAAVFVWIGTRHCRSRQSVAPKGAET